MQEAGIQSGNRPSYYTLSRAPAGAHRRFCAPVPVGSQSLHLRIILERLRRNWRFANSTIQGNGTFPCIMELAKLQLRRRRTKIIAGGGGFTTPPVRARKIGRAPRQGCRKVCHMMADSRTECRLPAHLRRATRISAADPVGSQSLDHRLISFNASGVKRRQPPGLSEHVGGEAC